MKKILVYAPDPYDGVSFYRQLGPLAALHDKLQWTLFSQLTEDIERWVWFKNYDICLMSRAHRYKDWYFAMECKKWGMPLWYDMDDALLHITPDNPVYDLFATDQVKKWIEDILKISDVVTVATPTLKEWLIKTYDLKNVVVIPNAIDDKLLKYAKPFSSSKRVGYRGSPSHMHDVLYYAKPIVECINSHILNNFVFFGVNPYFLTPHIKNKDTLAFAKTMSLINYYAEYCKFNPFLTFVPLIDNFFNRVKSNLAWIDATIAGSVCLAPDFPEFDRPGIVQYKSMDLKDFEYKMNKYLDSPISKLENLHRESREWQLDNILLSKINGARMEIINNL